MAIPKDDVIEEVVEVIEEVKPSIASQKEEKKSLYDAFWVNPEGDSPLSLMVYTISGLSNEALRVGPFTVVAPNQKIACRMLDISSPIILSVGEYFVD